MQETRVNKVSRRFYIDHADDHAVVRSVPVAIEVIPRAQSIKTAGTDKPTPIEQTGEHRLSKLVHSAVRRPRALRKRA
jgi:hypothetical protein